MDIAGNARIAESAGEDGVEVAPKHGEAVGRDSRTVAKIAVGAPVEFAELNVGPRCLDGLESLGDDFLSYSISGNDGDTLSGRLVRVHGRKATITRAE